MRRILLSLALVALVASVATADTYVWWDLASPVAGVTVTQSGSGKALLITRDIGVAGNGALALPLQMWIHNATPQTGLTGYGVNVWKGDAGLTMSGVQNLNPPAWTGTTTGVVENGTRMLDNYGRKRQSGGLAYTGTGAFISGTLNIAAGDAVGSIHNVFEGVSSALFGATPPGAHLIYFGGNAGVSNSVNLETAPTTGAVITFTNTPEPATLVLLGLGMIGLIRRR